MTKIRQLTLALILSLSVVSLAKADYANISIDGIFSDWDDVSVFATDAEDNAGSLDFNTLQIANDENFFYFRYTLHTAINPNADGGVFVSIDEDNDTSTGFDIFGLGIVGSDAGWQNDFAFEQTSGSFNNGSLTNATYNASPFNTVATSVEVSIDRAAIHTDDGAAVFPADGQQIGFMLWTEVGADDVLGSVGNASYTMMAPPAVPEPTSAFLLSTFAFGLCLRRRRV